MSEATGDPSVQTPAPPVGPAAAQGASAPENPAEAPREPREASIPALLEAGAHFGHQTRRWNPQMKRFIFGERNGVHIIDLDQTLPRLVEALEFLRETVAQGGKVLFVGTKRQAQKPVKEEAQRCSQYYVNNRWLGGMLTNFRTVKKSIELFKGQLDVLADAEKVSELSKKELSRLNRSVTKYRKSLDGIREIGRLPDALFIIDLNKEHIAVSEARRLGIPIVAVVDTNCSPEGIDFVIPGNDDAIRAIQFYCAVVADSCQEGAEIHNERLQSQATAQPEAKEGRPVSTRRVVEIKQPSGAGGGRGRGGDTRRRQAGGTHSAAPRSPRAQPPVVEAAPAPDAAPKNAAAAAEAPEIVAMPASAEAPESVATPASAEAPESVATPASAEAPEGSENT